jgi:hypothetical protein
MKKLLALALALTAVCSMGAELRTQNFVVIAANPQVCQKVAEMAEKYRREKAIQWLGKEMPQWSEPCPLHVTVAMDGPRGETEFTFAFGRVNSQRMKIHGPLDRLLYSVLPHEITHTVFANHFKTPVPRWADEGGSVLSEDDLERDRHDKLVRSILNKGQQIPMRTLLSLKEYPPQVMCLYAQGFSISDYLVKRSNRQHFLNFVGDGMQHGWDAASKSYFGHNSVEELEQAWLKHLRDTKSQPNDPILAANSNANKNQNTNGNGAANFMGTQSGRTVRLTVPLAQPADPPATTRGAMPTPDQPIMRPAGQTQWEPGVRLEPPVPILAIPRIPPIPAVQAGWPR